MLNLRMIKMAKKKLEKVDKYLLDITDSLVFEDISNEVNKYIKESMNISNKYLSYEQYKTYGINFNSIDLGYITYFEENQCYMYSPNNQNDIIMDEQILYPICELLYKLNADRRLN